MHAGREGCTVVTTMQINAALARRRSLTGSSVSKWREVEVHFLEEAAVILENHTLEIQVIFPEPTGTTGH